MAQRNVERLIGQLATDPALRNRFSEDAAAVLAELLEQGYELTAVEIEALATLDREALRGFAASLDGRLRRLER